jgi:pimeloyl-ACP methyl ester carboxylesterase
MRPTWRSALTRTSAALVAVLVAGCSAAPTATARPTAEPAPIAWTACGENLDCATVQMPLDHAEPDGRQVPIAVVRHRATDPAQRIGILFYNPGGPGGSATDVVRTIGSLPGAGYFSPDVLARFDVVGMDPRGIGDSGAVRCLTDDQRRESLVVDNDPDVVGGRPLPELRADAAELAAGCLAHQDADYLASLSTDVVAQDMDRVRAALGEERLTYLGASYGTLLGATYATLFPQHVRQMVLDAPMDPDLWRTDPMAASTEQAVSGEQNLDRYLATCRAEGPAVCPFGAGNPEAAFDALIDRLETQPLGTLDGYWALTSARAAVFDRNLWPVLTAGLMAAEQGDGTLLWTLATAMVVDPETGTPNALTEANLAVNCLDRAVPTDLAAHTAQAEEAAAQTNRFRAMAGYTFLACADWPVRNTDRYTEPLTGAGAPPILVVGGREDSQTPYPWARAMVAGLDDAVLLTREGVGHGSYRTSGPCVDRAVDGTLIDGVLPADGTVCGQEPPATAAPYRG